MIRIRPHCMVFYHQQSGKSLHLSLKHSVHETSLGLVIADILLPRYQALEAELENTIDDGR